MKKTLPKIFVVICLSGLFACQVTSGHKDTIALPEGTTVETADKIIKTVWEDDFIAKISEQFPNFNPINNPSTQGISLKWFKLATLNKDKKKTLSLHVEIKYKGSLDNPQEILRFAKEIVERGVTEYFKKK